MADTKAHSAAQGMFWRMKSTFARKDKEVHQDGMQKTSSTAQGMFWRTKSKFVRKDKDVHRDGIKRFRCPKGITEKDVNIYFERLVKEYGQEATQADNDLHAQAVELLRAHKFKTFQNAELTIVGDISAVRFVSGKGRRKFRLELLPQKVQFQVHVENLLCGFIRAILFIAAILEAVSSMMSAWSVVNVRSDEADDDSVFVTAADKPDHAEDDTLLMTVLMASGDILRGLVGFLAAMETINSNSALFTPVYGSGYGRGHDQGSPTYGVGLWPLGPRRWLFRGLLYATVACRGRLHVLRATDFLLPVDTLNAVLLYSAWILSGAAFLSVLLHVLHVPFPSLLKAPWTSVTLPSDSRQQVSSSANNGLDADTSPFGDSGFAATGTLPRIEDQHPTSRNSGPATGTLSRMKDQYLALVEGKDGIDSQEDQLDGNADCRCHCWLGSLPASCQLRPCTASLCLQCAALFLCLTTALLLSVCHVTRFIHSVDHQSSIPIMHGGPTTAAAILLCTAVGAYQAIGFFQTITTRRFALPVTVRTSLLLHAAGVSSVWSRDVVTWLTVMSGSGQSVGVALAAGSMTSLLLPALLRTGDAMLACRKQQPRRRQGRACFSCSLRALVSRRDLVQRGAFMAAVLLAVSGMTFAVISLPLPIARVRSEYTDDLLEAVKNIRDVQSTSDDHYQKVLGMMGAKLCGGVDMARLKEDMKKHKAAAASLTVNQLRAHCDEMSWSKSVETQDPFCEEYGAARLYLNGSMAFNSSLHDTEIKQLFRANQTVQDNYFNRVIECSRGEQLKTLKIGETSLSKGTFKTREECIVALCAAQNAALLAMLIPFAGTAAKIVYMGLVAVDAALRLIIKLSRLQLIFLQFKTDLAILVSKFAYYREEKTIQFSLANFNLIYLAYPALLAGCVGVLLGFWYRKGAPLSQRRRASVLLLLPLVFLNLFGLSVSFAWSYIVTVLGEVAPMIDMTVTTDSALLMLRISYGLTLSSLVLFLLLGFVESRHVQTQGQTKKDGKAATPDDGNLETADTEATELAELSSIHVTTASAGSSMTDVSSIQYMYDRSAQHRRLQWTAGAGFPETTTSEGGSTDDLLTLVKDDKVKAKSKVKVKGFKGTQASASADFSDATTATEGGSTDDLLTLVKDDKVKARAEDKVKGVKGTLASASADFSDATTATEGGSMDDLLTLVKDDKAKAKSKVKATAVKIIQGTESRSMVWVLALLISLGSACLMTVIIWKPVFAFDFDLNADMKAVLKRVENGIESTTVARLGIYNEDGDRCSLVHVIAKTLLENYMKALKKMVFDSYKDILKTVHIKSHLTAIPAIQLIQIPLLLTVYLPLAIILWSLLMIKVRPSFVPPPRATARLINTMAWLSMGWLTSGVLFLTALAQGEVVPMFRFQVFLGEGFPYVMAANVMQIMASQELRIATKCPVL